MYRALYRKYRSNNFDEIVGQEKIVEILKNQIREKKVGHAYLFSGLRGSGKTSIAKIFAKAINCPNIIDGNPCGQCELCISVDEGKNTDIIEMDAASNNGVNDIRLIRDEIAFAPTMSEYKVYIIDEVHMLSTEAFNALLKTLEDPPSHVKFILATTEPQKLPETILSRCQKFNFKRISEEQIQKHLRKIADIENIDIDDEAIEVISYLGKGSMRDSISILDSVSILDKIKKDDVREVVSMPTSIDVLNTVKYILEGDLEHVVEIVNYNLDEGKEALNYLEEILRVLNEIIVNKQNNIYNSEEKSIISYLESIDKLLVYSVVKNMTEVFHELKFANNRSVILLSNIIKATMEIQNKKIDEQKQKERNIENAHKIIQVLQKESDGNNYLEISKPAEQKKENPEKRLESTETLNISSVILRKEILKRGNAKLFAILGKAKMATKGLKVGFKITNLSTEEKNVMNSNETIEFISKLIKDITNKDVEIKIYE